MVSWWDLDVGAVVDMLGGPCVIVRVEKVETGKKFYLEPGTALPAPATPLEEGKEGE